MQTASSFIERSNECEGRRFAKIECRCHPAGVPLPLAHLRRVEVSKQTQYSGGVFGFASSQTSSARRLGRKANAINVEARLQSRCFIVHGAARITSTIGPRFPFHRSVGGAIAGPKTTGNTALGATAPVSIPFLREATPTFAMIVDVRTSVAKASSCPSCGTAHGAEAKLRTNGKSRAPHTSVKVAVGEHSQTSGPTAHGAPANRARSSFLVSGTNRDERVLPENQLRYVAVQRSRTRQ